MPSVSATKQMASSLKRVGTSATEGVISNLIMAQERDEGPLRSWARKVLSLPPFDNIMGIVIVINMAVMIVETDRSAMEDEVGSKILHWTEVFGWLVLVIFVFELLLRLFVFRCLFFQDSWNVFDCVIVVTDAVFSVLGLIIGNTFPVSILRIFRLAKLARVSKVLRVFTELRLMLVGLLSAVSAIFWGTLLLLFCLLVWSMVAVLFIHPLNKEIEYDGCERCSRAYSSVMQATLTFWQQIVTGDSWGQATIPLLEKHPITALFFIPVFLSIGMAVMNLILGVVVNVAEQAKDEIRTEEDAEKAIIKLEKESHLFQLCERLDTDNSGALTHEEIYACLEEPGEFQDHVMALEISKEDFDIAWAIMDAGKDGAVSYKDFVSTLCKMKSSDTDFLLAYIKSYITEIRNIVLQVMDNQHREEMEIEQNQAEDIQHIKQQEEAILAMEMQQLAAASDHSEVALLVKEEKFQALAGLQSHPGESDAQSTSKHGSLAAPDTKNIDRLRDPSSDASNGVASKLANDETEVQLQNICNDIGTMRIEIKDILLHISRKLGPPVLPSPPILQESMNAVAYPDLLVVPEKRSTCMLTCCTNPPATEKRTLSDRLSAQGPHSDLVSMALPNDVCPNSLSSTPPDEIGKKVGKKAHR